MRDQVKPSFVIFDVRALCESALKVSEIMQLSLACLLKRVCVRDGNHKNSSNTRQVIVICEAAFFRT